MVKHLPVDNDDDFIIKVESYIKHMERLPRPCQLAIKAAYIFATKAPPEEREDCFQDYYLAVHKEQPQDEALAYTIARRRWINWVRNRAIRARILRGNCISLSQYFSPDGQEISNTISDGNSLINNIENAVDVEKVLQILPDKIKPIVLKRLNGVKLEHREVLALSKYINWHGQALRELIKNRLS
jgi:DNA-directed RNA polymerase specialized sigma24 family protein